MQPFAGSTGWSNSHYQITNKSHLIVAYKACQLDLSVK